VGADGTVQRAPTPEGPDAVKLALADQDVRDVLRLLNVRELDAFAMYKVHEIIGGHRIVANGWATATQDSAFTASVNRPDVLGDAARHARSETTEGCDVDGRGHPLHPVYSDAVHKVAASG
jgi:hypothetical protein